MEVFPVGSWNGGDESSVKIQLAWNQEMGFWGEGPSGHRVMMDAAQEVGGSNQGARPTELLLMALGGCTGMDVLSILRKMQVPVKDLTISVQGTQVEEHPRHFSHIQVVYEVHGVDLPYSKVKRAVELSQEKYCPVAHTLAGRVKIDYQVKLVEAS